MNRVKSVMLLTLLSLILMAIGGVVGGQNGAMTMFLISLAINFYTYWNSDKMALRAYNAQPLAESQVPELYGRDPEHAAVAVTEGILSMLNRDELAGVISHELSHVKHRDTLIMTLSASIATAISYIANIAQWAAIFGTARDEDGNRSNPIALIVTIVIAPLAASLIQFALSRSREYMADASGARICGKPLALASALLKLDDYAHHRVIPDAKPATSGLFIINPLAGVGGVANLFSTHPSTEERVKKLREIAAEMHSF